MNPTRLAELNHQRALVREQLEWLDREIARESSGSVPPHVIPASPLPRPIESVQISAEAEAYQPDPVSAANDTRRGCLVAVVIISLLILGAFTAIYFLKYRDRPLLFFSDEAGSPGKR